MLFLRSFAVSCFLVNDRRVMSGHDQVSQKMLFGDLALAEFAMIVPVKGGAP